MAYISTFDTTFFVLLALQSVSFTIGLIFQRYAAKQSLAWKVRVGLKYGLIDTLIWLVILIAVSFVSFKAVTTFLAVGTVFGLIYAAVMWKKIKANWLDGFQQRMGDSMAQDMVDHAHG